MKIEFANKTKIPFSHVSAGQCFLDEDDNVCLACEEGWTVILSTGEMYEVYEQGDPDKYMVKPISAKVVVLEME